MVMALLQCKAPLC